MSRPGDRPSPRGPRALAALAILAVAGAAGIELSVFERDLQRDAARDLLVVATQRAQALARWREERLSDGRVMAANVLVAHAVTRARSGDARAREELGAWCAATESQHDEYDAAVVFANDGGRLAASGHLAGAMPPGEHLAHVVREAKPFLTELHRHADGELHADLVAPLPPAGREGASPGYVLLRVDSDAHLVPTLQAWAGRWATARAVLVQRGADGPRVVASGEPDPSPLPRPLTTATAGALASPERVAEGVDARGVRVLAAAAAVPGSALTLVEKADLSEVFGPLRDRAYWEAVVGLALAAVIILGAQLWWRGQREEWLRREHGQELRRLALERHFGHLTRHATDIQLLFDGGMRIVEANERAAEAYGRSREELIGLPARELLAPRARVALEERLRGIAAGRVELFETLHQRRDGTPFPVEVSAHLIELDGERYLQSVIRDVSGRKAMERALRVAEDRLGLVLAASGVGVWDWSAWSGEVFASDTLLRMLGHDRAALAAPGALDRVLHPDDRAELAPRLEALVRGHLDELAGEVRLRTADGGWMRARCRARILQRDEAGAPVRVAGTVAALPESEGEGIAA